MRTVADPCLVSPAEGDAASAAETRPFRPVRFILKAILSAALLVVLFSRIDAGRLWDYAGLASPAWLAAALGFFVATILVSAWRWSLLLRAQGVIVPGMRLVASYLVATFYNNFLPSNIGGDVIRVKDTAAEAGSKTRAATIILVDRGLGLMGLVFVAALGASFGYGGDAASRSGAPVLPWMLWLGFAISAAVSVPTLLKPEAVGRLLSPLAVFSREWVEERLLRMTKALGRFGEEPKALANCFIGAIVVQSLFVCFYVAVAWSMRIDISPWSLAVIVPVTFVVQMLPISINGFGVREATFAFYFSRAGLPVESALAVSFMGAALVMLVSLGGLPVHLARRS